MVLLGAGRFLMSEVTLERCGMHRAVEELEADGALVLLYIACAPRRITQKNLELRAVPIGTILNVKTTTSQKCTAFPRRAGS